MLLPRVSNTEKPIPRRSHDEACFSLFYVACPFIPGIENGKPVITVLLELPRKAEWVKFVQKSVILA